MYGGKTNHSRIYKLYTRLFKCKQNDHSLVNYVDELYIIWREINTLQHITDNIVDLIKQHEMLRINKFYWDLMVCMNLLKIKFWLIHLFSYG